MRISDWSSDVCSSDLSKLDRNRVDVTLTIKEGKAAKIRHINLIGNEKFEQEDLTDSWESAESNWLSWYRRDDQYSREKLSGDLEKLNNYYQIGRASGGERVDKDR